MKTKFIFLVLLIVCFSCGTNNKPVSEAQKEKIKGEVKEVMSTIIKGVEEVNFDMFVGNCLNSPDFVFLYNGNPFNYQQFADLVKTVFANLINAKCTIVDEKYMVIDNSNVLYTGNSKWQMNYKDGHAILDDPWVLQYIFKKVDNKWKVISANESGVEKSAKNTETSKELNQVELMKLWTGSWKCTTNKDTIVFWDSKLFGNGLEGYFKYVTNGKTVIEGKQLWGYDETTDKFNFSDMTKGVGNIFYLTWFTTKNKAEIITINDINNPENAKLKWEMLLKSPDMFLYNTIINGQLAKSDTYIRVK